jgi:lysophospholipase L1-like esterase
MFQKVSRRITAAALGLMTAFLPLSGVLPDTTQQSVSAAQTEWRFDLGGTAESGYTSVSASQAYDASKGYGFRNPSGVKDVSASGSGAASDAVQFTDTENSDNTFDVDLPNGLYRVTVTLGDTNRTSVYMENMLQIVNMTGNNAVDSILIPVTDGQLNLRAAAGKTGYAFSISSVEISFVSTETELPRTIWMCGDSTVCNYYPLDTSTQAGWGQVLSQYVDTSVWQVRDMAASGQYAKGFVDAGQFDAIETYGKEGDLYIISIGINDTNYSNAEEYYTVVTDMVQRAKAKGMTVILVKQQGRASDVTNHPTLTGRWFGSTLDQIGTEQEVQVIDLFNLFFDYAKSIGQEATTTLYMDGDDLHPNRQGAMKLAELAASQIDWNALTAEKGAVIDTSRQYLIRNQNSGMLMTVENGTAQSGTNVSQQSDAALQPSNLWTLSDAGNGYYTIYSALGNGKELLLDLSYGDSANGTNIAIFENTNADAQLFKFLDNGDGSYCIVTKSSNDKSCVEVKNASTESGMNIQEWERNGNACQNWTLEPVTYSEKEEDTVLGDLNEDHAINVFDLIRIKQSLQGSTLTWQGKRNGDTDADGKVSMADAVAVQKYLLGLGTFDATENNKAFYYAVDMSYCRGAWEDTNTGYQGDAYVNLDNTIGSFLEWKINVPESGNYLCTFSTANGSSSNRQMKLEVNGAADYWMQDFLSTGSWTTWTEHGIVLPLTAGQNVIRMTSETADGGPNVDYLRLEKTEEPIAEIYVPTLTPEETTPTDQPTIYIAGDSTVQTYRASYAPQQGWGAYLADYVPDNMTVSNHAIAGRSSKSFYDNGRLDTILNEMKEGDYLLIQFGINDSAYNNEERYAPVSGTVPGTEGSFEFYIAKYIEGTLEKGGTPILVTTVLGLKAYNQSTGKFEGSYQNYCDAMKQLAAYYNIPCIDLNALMVDHYNAIGYDTAYTYHLISTDLSETDMTHFTETGAAAVAKLVADEMKKQNLL